MDDKPNLNRFIEQCEREAREFEARANALDNDATEFRQRAETSRKTAEYLRKSQPAS